MPGGFRCQDLERLIVFGAAGAGVMLSLMFLYLLWNASQTGWQTIAAFNLYGEAMFDLAGLLLTLGLSLSGAALAWRRLSAPCEHAPSRTRPHRRAILPVLLILVLAALVPLAPSARAAANPAQVTVISGLSDTYLASNLPNTNFCSQLSFEADGGASFTDRFLVQFSLASIPANADILSATLDTYISAIGIDGNGGLQPGYGYLDLYRVTSSWAACTVTWNNFGAGTPPIAGSASSEITLSNETQAFQMPYRIDITTILKDWHAGTYANYGLLGKFFADTSGLDNYVVFDSDDNAFGMPTVTITYTVPSATVQPYYYCDGGPCEPGVASGDGLPDFRFRTEISEAGGPYHRVDPEGFSTNLSTSIRLRVTDFFLNELYNQSKTVTTNPFYWDVPIPYRYFQVLNERTDISVISISAGGTPMVVSILPGDTFKMPLKSGVTYTITFSLKDRDQNTIGTLTLVRTITQETAYIVNGTNLQEILTDLGTLEQTVNEFNDLLQPGVLLTGDFPFVPDRAEPVIFEALSDPTNLDPYRTTVYSVHRNGTGSSFQLGSSFSAAEPTVTVLEDNLFLAGSYTRLYVNDTKNTTSTADDTVLVNTTSALGYKALGGQNVTVRVLGGTVTADRFAKVRIVNAFSWSQDTETNTYSYGPVLSNPLNVSETSVYMFASWVPNHTPDPNTVEVLDVQNSIVLQRGVNYDITDGGVYLMLNSLAAGTSRSFRITYEQALNDTNTLEPSCYPGVLKTGTYGGHDYSLIEVVCTNLNVNDYTGRVVFVLKTSQAIDRSSVIVVDGAGREVAGGLLYWNDERTLVVQRQAVSAHASVTYSVYFTFEPELGTVNWFRSNSPLIVVALAIAAMISAAGYILPASQDPRSKRRQEISRPAFVGLLGLLLIVIVIAYVV